MPYTPVPRELARRHTLGLGVQVVRDLPGGDALHQHGKVPGPWYGVGQGVENKRLAKSV